MASELQLHIKLGIDRVAECCDLLANYGRIGLCSNQSATSSSYRPAAEVIADACFEFAKLHVNQSGAPHLVALFGPQHGYMQTEQVRLIIACLVFRLPFTGQYD